MNKVQKQILDNIVAPAIRQIPYTTLGTVESYDVDLNIAVLIIEGINSEFGYKRYPNVPVSFSNGIKTSSVFPGDVVIVQFFNGSASTPVIIGLADTTYAATTREKYNGHREAGGGISDLYRNREGFDWM